MGCVYVRAMIELHRRSEGERGELFSVKTVLAFRGNLRISHLSYPYGYYTVGTLRRDAVEYL